MEELQDLVMKNEFDEPDKKGSEEKIDVMDDYINYNLSYLNCNKKYKIVVDAGNGMAGYTFPKTFDKIENIEYIPMYFELDVSFPNHEANPLKTETVVALQKKVLDEGADLGIAFDGDADRAMFIDEKGNYISADFTTCLLGLSILKNDPGALLLRDLRSSRTVTKTWLDAGAKTNKCRVGHSLIKAQMIKEGAIFAGELSGHYYFKHKVNDITFFCENAIVATILILNLLAEKNKKMSELVAPLRKYYQSGEINSKVEDKVKKIQELQEKYNDGEITHLDGISVDYDDWWFNVRPSNTENLLRLNVEASTKELMEEKRDELLKIIQRG